MKKTKHLYSIAYKLVVYIGYLQQVTCKGGKSKMYKAINPRTKAIETISEEDLKNYDIFDKAFIKSGLKTQVEMMQEELECTMI